MKICRQRMRFMAVMILVFVLVLGPGFSRTALASSEDVAMFYDELSQYGQWVEYENYGPVWRPSQVAEDWRPYTDGRWVPTNDGNVFETQEPWGWATYHYGNWMPTEGYGWVWVPGRTWYPSTVEWRTSPEDTPAESAYIGWAPIPPPNYVPPASYAAPSYAPGSPLVDALTAPFWIFAKATSFLLGLGQLYTPAYSYVTAGVLVPPAYVPVFYPQTVIVRNYITPAYYPPAFVGARPLGFAAYNWGPPPRYLYRAARINQAAFNRAIYNNSLHMRLIHNVVPPNPVIKRHPYFNQIIPPALAQGQPLPRSMPVSDIRKAQANLYKPNFLPPPLEVPKINTQFSRIQPVAVSPGQGIPGTALPPRATLPLTPQMERQIQSLPPERRFVPAGAQPPPSPAALQRRPAPGQPGTITKPEPGARTQPVSPPSPPVRKGGLQPGPPISGPPPAGTFAKPGAPQPGAAPLPPGYKGLTPEQRRQQEQEHQRLQRGGTPGRPQPPQPDQERFRQKPLQPDHQQTYQRRIQQMPQKQQERQRQPQVQPQQPPERFRQQRVQQQRPQPIPPRSQPQLQPKPQAPPRMQRQPQPQPPPQAKPQQQQQKPERGQPPHKKPPEQP
ncbi:MAG: DUF6600 domain-containing protein [Thermodesulfobacteriota bacterium]